MKKKSLILVTLLTVLLLIISSAGASEQKEVVVKEWKIPFLNCLTGAIASIGEYLQVGSGTCRLRDQRGRRYSR